MKKTIGNVQVAETKQPVPEESKPESHEPVVPGDNVSGAVEPNPLGVDLSKVNPQILRMVENAGLPIERVLSWASSVEQRFKELENFAPTLKKIDDALTQAAQRQQQPQPPQMEIPQQIPQPYNPASFVNLLPAIAEMLKGQPPQDDLLTTLARNSLQADIDLSKTLKNSIMSQILSKASKNITDAVLPE